MSWFVEHLHRDGGVLARIPVPMQIADAINSTASVRIGRALDNDLILDDPYCAAYHARLEIGADGTARLIDLGTSNGIVAGRNKRTAVYDIKNDDTYRLGQTLIRVRSNAWPLAPERLLSKHADWPLALIGFVLVLTYIAWQLWLSDVQEKSPPYLYALSSVAAALCLWSAMYALFGRLITGAERFFSHLFIASTGYLSATLLINFLELLAFSSSWLWPLRINQPLVVIIAAITVRYHLRLADPRHWRTLRIGLTVVTVCVIVIPIAQQWISHKRLTDIQTLQSLEYPALRLAQPLPLQEFSATVVSLKEKVDKTRKNKDSDVDDLDIDDESQ